MIKRTFRDFCIFLLCISLLCACGGGGGGSDSSGGNDSSESSSSGGGSRTTISSPSQTDAPGTTAFSNDSATIDASNTDKGYIMINYTGSSEKVQVQITNPSGEVYPYPLGLGGYKAFPLTDGSGTYTVEILENVSGDMYSMCLSESIDAQVSDEFAPYLYPNQYVDYTESSNVVKKAIELSDESSDDLDFVTKVYEYTISTISYDTAFAQSAPVNYIPNPDSTMSSGKGICFDYSSVMSSMLRCQGIPTKLVVGYSGEAYHAWISVFLKEQGWVENIIEFDGTNWSLMDPTLAASNDASAVGQYIGDGSNYTAKYYY